MKTKITIGVIVALIVGGVLGYVFHQPLQRAGSIAVGTGTPTSFDGISVYGGVRQGVPSTEYPVAPAANAVIGNGLATLVTSGSLPAKSQYVIISNPFSATSTITYANVQGNVGTTTVDIILGTTTQTSAITNNSQVSTDLIDATTISTSTSFFSVAGVTVGSGTGFTSPGVGSMTEITVGPKENIALLATSSYAVSSAIGNSGLTGNSETASITYTIEWQR